MRPFRLQNVARVRQMEEDQAAAELLRRREFRRGADRRSAQAYSALEDLALPAEADVMRWQAAIAARVAASASAFEAATAAELAQSDELLAQGQWSAARRRATTIDKLAERHRLAEQAADNHAEQVVLDEVAAQRARVQGQAR